MTLLEKEEQLCRALAEVRDSQARLAWVVERGRQAPSLPPELRVDANKVEGCLSNLWFVADFRNGRCYFQADSDSAIVRGISVVLCDFYSQVDPSEILGKDPSFLGRVGITQHLSPNRRNALSRLWEKIREFAEKHRSPCPS